MSYLDNETQYLAKYASFITGQALELVAQLGVENNSGSGLADQISAYKTYREAVVDADNSQQNQLDALTVLVNYAPLDPVPIPPTFSAFNPSFIPTPSYIGVHNDLSGLNIGDYQHLTQAQLSKLNNLPTAFTFAGLAGSPNDNAALAAALASKQATIPTGTSGQFYGWDKTMKSILWSYIGSTPTTLAGYGISASDTLFDNKYLRLISPLTGLAAGTATPITATDSVLVAFQNLQAQISAGSGITALTGDVTASGTGSVVATIGANRVTNAMLAQVATARFKGRITSGTGNIEDLTATQATSLLNIMVGDSGSGGTKGLVPAPATGDATKFLRGDATWQTISGGGTVTSVAAAGPTGILTWSAAVTGAGTLTATLVNQSAATVFAGPAIGSAAAPTFRTLVATDIPTISIAQVSALSSALAGKLGVGLTQGKILIGNISDLASPQTPFGDVVFAVNGQTTIQTNVVTFAKFQQATGPQLLIGTPDIAGAQNFRQITLAPATLQIDALGVMSVIGGGGSGTVTTVSVVTANGFAGSVANATTTPAITLTTSVTGILKGNGTAISAASAGTDYVAPGAITSSGLTMATARLLGRTTASTGAIEEISVGTGLTLSAGTLTASAAGTGNQSFTSQTSITVTHSRGYYPLVQVIDNSGNLLSPTSVVHGSTNAFTVTLSSSTTGNIIYA